jgi:hypothetical protein
MYEVPFYQVSLQDEFWTPKIDTNRKVTIPIVYQHCKETGRIDAFKLDWRPGKEPVPHKYCGLKQPVTLYQLILIQN